ncbi:MAG: succinate dehydrogenase flavoprotein subunit [Candidatus Eisenbacteria bacterium]|uniref:succinate dehydrogenase n=1 Tax=Eiseniibacteriota bacterium TaxID=2212470 RepID=A0A948WF09_UNCEI|nr:succinate dehydrogenase flavoprotein subunit [Candidatus Eisenbacteria bacterium]MBU1950682.1 succinate dehydrogenase flavoprotein subunit [Candidatus Eisenbacteria bacterium]MBU2693263.1 succinate dehydrogenase flavoprotein subunit [Candidatus Eisenbacteria bacterium]
MAVKKPKIIVVGGGLGGLWATIRIAEAGYDVDIFSLFQVKRSHSACAQGGINACLDTKGQRDSIRQHIIDTIKGGAYLANQPPIKTMCEEAPGLIRTFDRMGVTWSRTAEGVMDLRLFGGVKNKRTCFSGATTGQQLLYVCDEQVRKYEEAGKVHKYEWWEFLSIVKDSNGACKGIVAIDLRTMETKAFRADAVVLATGGLGLVYGKSTNSTNSTGAAAARVYQQGAKFINGEFIQFHPTAMPGDDKNRLMSEAARGEGGRIWVPKNVEDTRPGKEIPEEERWYFLEEWYPAYGNTVPRDVASRAIWKVCRELNNGIGGKDLVYLDLSHRDEAFLRARLGGIMEIYEKFAGEDPTKVPMKIFPAVHYSMGGLWVDWEKDEASGGMKQPSARNHQTSIPGLFAAGECDGAYHGANRLGANSLLSASFSGRVAGESVAVYVKGLKEGADSLPGNIYSDEKQRQDSINQGLMNSQGDENPFLLHHDLGELMRNGVSIIRDNKTLDEALAGLQELKARFNKISLDDTANWSNQPLIYARQVYDMIVLGEVLAKSARMRDECRGSHWKPEFELKIPEGKFSGDPEFEEYRAKWKANNEQWLKTTVAEHTQSGPQISYEKIEISVLPPDEPRDYR